jgi:hypothetical protein
MAGQRGIAQRAARQESDVLLRQLDAYLTAIRSGHRAADLDHAERMATALRTLIAETTSANAVDRARVRAAVHYFVSRGTTRPANARLALLTGGQAVRRPLTADDNDRVINTLLHELGRDDLTVPRE